VTRTTFQELLLTPFNVHEILGFEILSSEKHFCHWEISEILLRVRGLDPCLWLPAQERKRVHERVNTWFLVLPGSRPTQSIMYLPLQVNRFRKSFTYLSVQIFKIIPEIFILQNLILRTRSCGTGFITQSIGFFISIWQNLSDGNDLYWRCTS